MNLEECMRALYKNLKQYPSVALTKDLVNNWHTNFSTYTDVDFDKALQEACMLKKGSQAPTFHDVRVLIRVIDRDSVSSDGYEWVSKAKDFNYFEQVAEARTARTGREFYAVLEEVMQEELLKWYRAKDTVRNKDVIIKNPALMTYQAYMSKNPIIRILPRDL